MKSLWSDLISLGVQENYTDTEKKQIIKSNIAYYVALPVNLLFTYLYFVNGYYPAFVLLLLGSLSLLVALFLNKYNKFSLSSSMVTYVALLLSFLGYLYYGKGFGFEYVFFVLLIVKMKRRESKNKVFSFILILIICVIVSKLYLIHYGPISGKEIVPNYTDLVAFLACVFWLFVLIYSSYTVNLDFEKKNETLMKELKLKNQELTDFAYMVSHDLKQPLRQINNFSQLLGRSQTSLQSNKSANYLSEINNGISRMNAMINDLLSYATIGKEVELETLPLSVVYRNVLDDLDLQIQKKDAYISFHNIPSIEVPSTYFNQLFQNFIANALKFTAENVEPEITISSWKESGTFHFSISDNGIGIDDAFKEEVFLAFRHLNTKSQYEGSGIGLATCAKIVNRLDGGIDLESELGKGSKFHFYVSEEYIVDNMELSHSCH